VAAILACSGTVWAQERQRPGTIDAAAVAAFADEYLPREMARRNIPGTVFVWVSGGEIAIARGFGAAALEPRRAVDPERTVFRLASVSKTITATAALQLVERGLIDLRSDVRTYLRSFRLVTGHGPIALHHLLTHTAGFDERLIGAGARSLQEVESSSRYLARAMPPTFIEPGRVISYSNHGYALIGQLVEDVSGRPFADYVRQEVFEPLGMTHSGCLTGGLPAELAVAYEYVAGRHRALSPDYLQVSSAGAFYTTGTDLARFLIAHLRGGAIGHRRVLQPETVRIMHARQFSQTAQTSGWAYGFWEDSRDGHRALLHNGGGKGFRALVYLLPEQDAGFFLAYNLADRHEDGELLESFITALRRRFLPAIERRSDQACKACPVGDVAGDYVYVRRARTTVEKMIAVLNQVRVTTDENGRAILSGRSIRPTPLTPIGPGLFRRADGRGLVSFDAASSGPPLILLITDSGFPAVYERIPLRATLRAHVVWLLGMVLVFLYAAAWRPLAAIFRRKRISERDTTRWSIWLSGMASALNLLFIVGFPLAFFGRIEGGVPHFLYGIPGVAAWLLFIPPLSAMLTIAGVVAVVGVWRDARAPAKARLQHSVVAFALVAFLVFAWYWRLMPTAQG
jgi:CubicO group peptidase (beta-lactamase class C family)